MELEYLEYISGWQTLNIPNECGLTADWHPLCYFTRKKPNKMYRIDNNPLRNLGIKERFIPYLNDTYFIASFARAIADLVFFDETEGLRNCVDDFLDDREEAELFSYLRVIHTEKNVEAFMKFELTKLYFKEFKNA